MPQEMRRYVSVNPASDMVVSVWLYAERLAAMHICRHDELGLLIAIDGSRKQWTASAALMLCDDASGGNEISVAFHCFTTAQLLTSNNIS